MLGRAWAWAPSFGDTGGERPIETGATEVGGRLTLASHQPLFVTLVPPDETRLICDGICADIGCLCGQPWAVDVRAVLVSAEEAIELGRTLWADATVPV